MTRKNTPKKGLTRNPFPAKGVLNPGSLPGKWNDSMIVKVLFLALEGKTEKEIAVELDIHVHSIHYWKTTKPEFLEALQKGRAEYTNRVEQDLVHSAVGYSHPAIHFSTDKEGNVVQIPYTKHYPPNVTAQIFYLKNRARDRWMDVHKIEGNIQHQHILDLTKLSMTELKVLEKVGLKELPEHGSSTD